MKRKKWTEEEEAALIREYSAFLSSSAAGSLLAKLKTREKKFQPIADAVNAGHHLLDPAAFPFRWSWRDVSVKIQNMRHQYLNVKQKLQTLLQNHQNPNPSPPPSSAAAGEVDWGQGVHLWPNFLLYKEVFGDLDLDPPKPPAAAADGDTSNDLHLDSDDDDEEMTESATGEECEGEGTAAAEGVKSVNHAAGGDELARAELGRERCRGGGGGRLGLVGSRMAELGEIAMRREERRREREAASDEEEEEYKPERRWRRVEEEEEEGRERWRRREERREEEEMEWRERLLGMQMDHEKLVMQMHADACQAQMQMLGILVRLVCQFVGAGAGAGGGDGGLGGLPHPVMPHQHQQHQEQQSPESLVGDSGKNGDHSGGHYL